MTTLLGRRPLDQLLEAIAPLRHELDVLTTAATVLGSFGLCDFTNVALLDHSGDQLTLYRLETVAEHEGKPTINPMGTLPIASPMFSEFLAQGQVLGWTGEFPEIAEGGTSWQMIRDRVKEMGVQSGALIPLRSSTAALGTVTFLSMQPDSFSADSHEDLRRIGDILGLALEKTRLIEVLEQRLVEATATTERLVASNRDLEEFAYVASHDLQEPLRKIRAFGDRLEVKAGDKFTEQESQYLERVQDAASRMQALINDLLEFSRVNTQGREAEPVDLTTTISGVLSDLEIAVSEANASVTLGPLPAVVGDGTQLRQLFQNLIGNAIKFRAPDVAPVIEVTATLLGNDTVSISVADNGIGFDPKYLDRIFKPFQRLHGRGEYSGSGIGLAVCRRIAERHGGHLQATSEVGIGSTFTLTMPNQPLPANGDTQ